ATIEQKSLVKNPEIKLISNHLKKIVPQRELEYYIEVISVLHMSAARSPSVRWGHRKLCPVAKLDNEAGGIWSHNISFLRPRSMPSR
ncbi:hypothetical protein, partial [Lacticaseibacillus paracasei]|uniref:hypothetical protein n=1 Tax=Lacticaseibacillus paracasei TaxID=1597 RepID=UPI0022DFCA77